MDKLPNATTLQNMLKSNLADSASVLANQVYITKKSF